MTAAALLVLLALPQASLAPVPGSGQEAVTSVLDEGARPLTAREARARGVGRWVPDASALTLEGEQVSWRSGAGERGTVLVLTSLSCPLCRKLAPEVARVEDRARDVGFGFVHVALDVLDSPADLRAHVARLGLDGLVLRDESGAVAEAFDARTTTEVFVVDARGTLRYRGAINDQYGLRFALEEPRRRFLDDALRALIREDGPVVEATTAPGCVVERPIVLERAAPDVTYARDVARLVQASCVECHRAGGVAPFPLETYEDVARRASMLLAVVDDGIMPPWFAAHDGDGPSPWANDRSLLPGERDQLARWIAAGKPRGDEADLPAPQSYGAGGWALGEPDAVYALPRAFRVPAEGRVDYQYFVVPTGLERDRWVSGIEVRPGAVPVVHHVLAYALPAEAFENGRLKRWDLLDERRGFFAAWAPGAEPALYPAGHARELRAGTVLLFELHYTPNGQSALDRSSVGVHFADEDPAWTPERIVRTAGISNRSFRIPAGARGHTEASTGVVARPMRVTAFMPHMHLRGASFRFERVGLDGRRETLLDVPRYDFNWQLRYELAEPLALAAGERIDVVGVFDNSSDNLANPAPDRSVRWGPDTDDEMLIGFVDYVLVDEDLGLRSDDPQFVVIEPRVQDQLRALAAANGGSVPRAQLPRGARRDFDRLDRDGDQLLDPTELTLLAGAGGDGAPEGGAGGTR